MNQPTNQKTTNLAELFQRHDIQENYLKNRIQVSMDDIVDKPIQIVRWEEEMGPSMDGTQKLFLKMYFKLMEDDTHTERFVRTQSRALWDDLKAIPNEVLAKECVVTMVTATKTKVGGKRYAFSGRK